MKYYVYVLTDDNGKLYKGITNDLNRRLREHRSGHTKTTFRMVNIRVMYREELPERSSARKRELYLKSAAGRRFLKNILGL